MSMVCTLKRRSLFIVKHAELPFWSTNYWCSEGGGARNRCNIRALTAPQISHGAGTACDSRWEKGGERGVIRWLPTVPQRVGERTVLAAGVHRTVWSATYRLCITSPSQPPVFADTVRLSACNQCYGVNAATGSRFAAFHSYFERREKTGIRFYWPH